MVETSLIFPAAEYRRRVSALQNRMADADIDAVLLTTPPDIFYVTGFLTRFWESPARPWFMVIPAAGNPIAVIPAIGGALMERTWITDIRCWDAPDPEDDGVSLLAATLRSIARDKGTIGLPMGLETHLRMPVADYADLVKQVAPLKMADATDVIQRVREIKSEDEIDKIRNCCEIADRAFDRVPEIAGEGKGLDRIFADFQIALLQEGADWVSYLAGGTGQSGYGDVISPADASPLIAGDLLMLDTGAVKDGYFCDFDRNFSIGRASDAVLRAHAALYAATDRALKLLRPGMTARELYLTMTEALIADGQNPASGRFGHGLGLSLTEWPSFTEKDETVLREGMVLTLEPGVEIGPSRFMVHEENIVLRANGPELLSRRAPAELPVI